MKTTRGGYKVELLTTIYNCKECDTSLNKIKAEKHRQDFEHTVTKKVVGLLENDSHSFLKKDDRAHKFSSKKILHQTLKDFIREDREHLERMHNIFEQFKIAIGMEVGHNEPRYK